MLWGYSVLRAAWAMPSQVWRLFHQHQPSFAAFLLAAVSRPVPLLIHRAGVRASKPAFFLLREPIVMKQWFRSSNPGPSLVGGHWSAQKMPSIIVRGMRWSATICCNASAGEAFEGSVAKIGGSQR